MKTKLDKFRTRWLRWLGQKTREDRDDWALLLEQCWAGWVSSVMNKCNLEIAPLSWNTATREKVKLYFLMGIHSADMEDLRRLDHLYCTDLLERLEGERKNEKK